MRSIITFLFSVYFIQPCSFTDVICADRKCITPNTQCVNNKCSCVNDLIGDGDFDCYRKNWIYGVIKCDPMLRTYFGEKFHFGLPCRYLVTHLETTLMWKENDTRVDKGKCEIQIHVFNKKHKGKIFVEGYDLALKIQYSDGVTADIKATKRIVGEASNGVYTYEEWSNESLYDPIVSTLGLFKKPINITANNGKVKITNEEDIQNEQIQMYIRACGVRATLRAFDKDLAKSQERAPGFAFGVSCAHRPKHFSTEKCLFLDEKTSLADKIISTLSPEDYLIYRALTQDVPQTNPGGNDHCRVVGNYLKQCTDIQLQQAFINCKWTISEPKFIKRCDSQENGYRIMKLFGDCVRVYCDLSYTNEDFRTALREIYPNQCVSKIQSGVEMLFNWLAA